MESLLALIPTEAIAGAELAPGAVGLGPYTQAGSTTNFVVSYDNSLANGAALAGYVLNACEADFQKLQALFGGITPPGLPFNIYVDPGFAGAYHSTCADTALHCGADGVANAADMNFLVIAEEVEVFEAAQNRGWNCGASNGEALSRVLATVLYPTALDGYATACSWLSSNRPNWVDQNDATDRDAISTGCDVLFLYFLHDQLGYSWDSIVGAGGATMEDTYDALTGMNNGWVSFSSLLAGKFSPCNLLGDDPFPILRFQPRHHYEIINWLIGSLADGPLWVLTPHGPVPVPPGPLDLAVGDRALEAYGQMRRSLGELTKLGEKLEAERGPIPV